MWLLIHYIAIAHAVIRRCIIQGVFFRCSHVVMIKQYCLLTQWHLIQSATGEHESHALSVAIMQVSIWAMHAFP